MAELIEAMLQAPERIPELNKQFQTQPAVLEAWFKAILEYENPQALKNDQFISGAMGIAKNVFQQYEITPAQTQPLVDLLGKVSELLGSFNGFLVLRVLLETGCVPHVGVKEVAKMIWGLLERSGQLKQSLTSVVKHVSEGLVQQLQLQQVLVSSNFQRQAKAGKELWQAVSVQQFVMLSCILMQHPGVQLGMFSAIFQTLLQLDVMLECAGRQLQRYEEHEVEIRGEITNSVVNSLKAFNEVFGTELQKIIALDLDVGQEGMRQQAQDLDRELQAFLSKHPEFLGYYRSQLVETLDVGIDYLIDCMQVQPAELLGDFATTALSSLLTIKTKYVQFVLFPLVQVQELQQSFIQVLFTTAFAAPTTSFEAAQMAAQYLMSIAARCTSFDGQLLEQLVQVLIAYCLQMDSFLAPEISSPTLQSSPQFLRFALAVKAVMYLVVFLWPQLQDSDSLREYLGRFCLMETRKAVLPIFSYVLEEFLGVLQRVNIVGQEAFDSVIEVFRGCSGTDRSQQIGVLTEFYPFEPVDFDQTARWVQSAYRSLEVE